MSFIQGILGTGAKKGNTVANNLQLQSSVYGSVIPIIYGTTRVAANLLWYGNFIATPVSSSKGGKGSVIGGGGKSGGGQYTYQVAVAMAFGEGPIQNVRNVYVDKSVTTLSNLGMSLFTGTYPQSPWGYLVAQQVPVIEVHTIPGSGPYQVAVNQGAAFYEDASQVSLNPDIQFTSVAGAPALNQYNVYTSSSFFPSRIVYTFNANNAGANVTMTVIIPSVGQLVSQQTIPLTAPYQLTVAVDTELGFKDEGVVSTGTPLANATSSPAPFQYSFASGGVYTFNAAQAGEQVSIGYYTYNGTQALGYNGLAYVAASSYALGESAALPNHNFEVQGIFSNSVAQEIVGEQDTIPNAPYTDEFGFSLAAGQIVVEFYANFLSDNGVTDIGGNPFTAVPSNPGNYQYSVAYGVYTFSSINYGIEVNINYTASIGFDADPSLVIDDLLTNVHYGAAFPSANVGNFTSYQAYCIANGLLISPCYNQQQQTSSLLQDIATATNSAFVWSEGVLNLIPYGDEIVSQFGYTYSPPSQPVYTFDDDFFMKNQNPIGSSAAAMNYDPVILTRKRPADQINSIKLECLDRNNNYNTAIIEAKDQALIEQFQLRQSASSNSHLFCNLAAGKQSAQLQLQRQAIRNVYSFQLDQRFIFLDPMDIVAINDSFLGLVNQWVRILQITENDDRTLSISAEEYLHGTGTAASHSFQTGLGYAPDYNIAPGDVNIPVIFEPTDALAGELAIWIAASGMNTSLWGGCDVYLSTDGNTYANVGRIKGASRQGVLTSPLATVSEVATGQTIDAVNVLSASLLESNGQLVSGSQSDATNLNTLCYVDGEYIAYETATLTDNDTYNMSYLVRGAYNSPIGSHATFSQFARLDSAIFEHPYAAPLIGTTVLIKFVSFNVWGGGYQDISTVQPFTYTVLGTAYTSPLPNVTGFATAYIAGLTQLIWSEVDDFRKIDYEVRQGSSWSNGNFMYRTTNTTQGSPIAGDGTYWVAAHFKVPNGGIDVYSETPVSITITGSQITQNVIASYDQAALSWPGTFVDTEITSLGLQLTPAGNILAITDYLGTPNILFFGTYVTTGTYTVPSGQIVNIGRVAPCQVIINLGAEVGYAINSVNILSVADYLNANNIVGVDLGNNTSAIGQIALSQDGVIWGAWQTWIPGSYSAKAFNARVLLESADPTVLAVLSDFTFIVDVPTLTQTGTNISIASGGTAITFTNPFNGGPGSATIPNIQVTILGSVSGDTAIITSASKTGFTLQIQNGGSGVSRNVNWSAEGF